MVCCGVHAVVHRSRAMSRELSEGDLSNPARPSAPGRGARAGLHPVRARWRCAQMCEATPGHRAKRDPAAGMRAPFILEITKVGVTRPWLGIIAQINTQHGTWAQHDTPQLTTPHTTPHTRQHDTTRPVDELHSPHHAPLLLILPQAYGIGTISIAQINTTRHMGTQHNTTTQHSTPYSVHT